MPRSSSSPPRPCIRRSDTSQTQTPHSSHLSTYTIEARSPNAFLQALRGVGGIILNAEGQRFCNELGRRGLMQSVRVRRSVFFVFLCKKRPRLRHGRDVEEQATIQVPCSPLARNRPLTRLPYPSSLFFLSLLANPLNAHACRFSWPGSASTRQPPMRSSGTASRVLSKPCPQRRPIRIRDLAVQHARHYTGRGVGSTVG